MQKVILYGSYARGDNNAHSDVDIMILVDFMENEIRERIDEVAELTFSIEIDYEVVLNG